ncbi:hypothetical protein QLX08_010268 [Tetragonisca angustula]|uniref:Uncharacterized protein n=1 Tax=Tetragonisca angustula TaxID=166442 RepID=A0AAW0ZCL1_9HYME
MRRVLRKSQHSNKIKPHQ